MNDLKDTRKGNVGSLGISEAARLAGVSARTLRYYETMGLLVPARTDAGYRVYREKDLKRLAQILAMKSCGLPLATIRRLLSEKNAPLQRVLQDHLKQLEAQGRSLEDAVSRTKAALCTLERIDAMKPNEAFESMKAQGIKDFEATYGQEARDRYGDDAIDASNARMMALTKDQWDAKELLEESIKVQLRVAMATGDPASDASAELARMHEKWISIHWGPGYAEDAYLGLVHGYLADPRFVRYYDSAAGEGATEFLASAVDAAHRK